MIVLHGGPTPNARKIAIALFEMGLAWRLEPVDILAGDQLTPALLALDPNNKTPVIVDYEGPGGSEFVLWETGAILLYLAEKTGIFMPVDPAVRAVCWQWLMFQVSGIGPMFGQEAHFTHYAAERHEYSITGPGPAPSVPSASASMIFRPSGAGSTPSPPALPPRPAPAPPTPPTFQAPARCLPPSNGRTCSGKICSTR